jgi:transcription initiation factor TFIIIB Brf1 subunit/transcription initiation factor TFIIB
MSTCKHPPEAIDDSPEAQAVALDDFVERFANGLGYPEEEVRKMATEDLVLAKCNLCGEYMARRRNDETLN